MRARATATWFGRGQAWFAFAMTMALMMVDYLDRQVIVSLFPHIKAEWGLSDKQLGALVSIVSVTVALGALPVALLADRWSRVRSIVVMATVWSLATISCMFTRNYGQLMAARALVGLGEAGYGSVGAALIASHFPTRHARGPAGGVFRGGFVGSVLGVMLGGLIAARWGWQAAFGVVGFPGLLLALMYLEGARLPDRRADAGAGAERALRGRAFGLVKSLLRSRTTLWVCIGAAAQLIVVSAMWAWLPSFLNRFHGISAGRCRRACRARSAHRRGRQPGVGNGRRSRRHAHARGCKTAGDGGECACSLMLVLGATFAATAGAL